MSRRWSTHHTRAPLAALRKSMYVGKRTRCGLWVLARAATEAPSPIFVLLFFERGLGLPGMEFAHRMLRSFGFWTSKASQQALNVYVFHALKSHLIISWKAPLSCTYCLYADTKLVSERREISQQCCCAHNFSADVFTFLPLL